MKYEKQVIERWKRVIEEGILACLSDEEPLEHEDCILELEQLVREMKAFYDKDGVYLCEECGAKVATNVICKTCYRKAHPWDTEI